MSSQLDLFGGLEEKITEQNERVLQQNPIVAQKHYSTITEVAKMFGVAPSLLRFWEKEFPQIKLRKNGKGDRLYTKEDIELIGTIYYLAKERKFTLEGTREYLKSSKSKKVNTQKNLVDELKQLQQFLKELKASL